MYCGTVKYQSAPGTPERAVEEAAALEEGKKLQRQAAIYRAGMGMPKDAKSPGSDKNVGNIVKAIIMIFINPFAVIKYIKAMFRP
jgi:hypothetical protein